MEAAASQARSDEEFADEQLVQHHSDAAKFTLRNAARNWRLALHFDEATRVENRIKKMDSNFDPDAFIASHGQPGKPLGTPTQAPHDWQNDPVVIQAPSQAPQASSIPRARPVRSPSPRQ